MIDPLTTRTPLFVSDGPVTGVWFWGPVAQGVSKSVRDELWFAPWGPSAPMMKNRHTDNYLDTTYYTLQASLGGTWNHFGVNGCTSGFPLELFVAGALWQVLCSLPAVAVSLLRLIMNLSGLSTILLLLMQLSRQERDLPNETRITSNEK